MKIVLASPLYPPDIAEPAPYIKELARRLSTKHAVTIITYGSLPERVSNVSITAISKQQSVFVRLTRFSFALLKAVKKADALFIENGPSTELPLAFVRTFHKLPTVFHQGDALAVQRMKSSSLMRTIERVSTKDVRIVRSVPLPRPEILPFALRAEHTEVAYEASWKAHLTEVMNALHGT